MFIYFFKNLMATGQSNAALEAAPTAVGSTRTVRPNRVAVVLAFLSIYFIWGSTYLAILYAVDTIPPLYTAGFRHLIAGSNRNSDLYFEIRRSNNSDSGLLQHIT